MVLWITIKRFLTNKKMNASNEIVLKQGQDTINDEVKVAEIPNNVYINVAENTTRKKTVSVVDLEYVKFSPPIDIIFVEPLTDTITPVSITSIFPEPGKRASVTPIDENGAYKHFSKNYRPVNELSTFSKILDS